MEKLKHFKLSKMFDILKPLLSWNIFTRKELESAKPVQNSCQHCKENCGNLFLLDNCDIELCGECLDNFYDNYASTTSELFKCPCHKEKIFGYKVK